MNPVKEIVMEKNSASGHALKMSLKRKKKKGMRTSENYCTPINKLLLAPLRLFLLVPNSNFSRPANCQPVKQMIIQVKKS